MKISKENADYFPEFICIQLIESISSSKFRSSFKYANTTNVFKDQSRNHKNNYKPVSILPVVSKIFEKLMNNQLSKYFEKTISDFQCGFWKGFSTQHSLLLMIEKWKHAVDNSKVFGALLTDLSKAFECVWHDLLTEKLNAYDFLPSDLKLVHNYFNNANREQRMVSPIAYGKKLYLEFHKDRSCVHFRLIYFSAISF